MMAENKKAQELDPLSPTTIDQGGIVQSLVR